MIFLYGALTEQVSLFCGMAMLVKIWFIFMTTFPCSLGIDFLVSLTDCLSTTRAHVGLSGLIPPGATIAGFLCLSNCVCSLTAQRWPKTSGWTCCPSLGALRWENRWPLWYRKGLVSVGFLLRILIPLDMDMKAKSWGFFPWPFPWGHQLCLFECPSKRKGIVISRLILGRSQI